MKLGIFFFTAIELKFRLVDSVFVITANDLKIPIVHKIITVLGWNYNKNSKILQNQPEIWKTFRN